MIAAVYARKSTEQNGVADEAKSVRRQVEHARAYATRKGWTVADEHVYVDDGVSGAEFANRPGFVRLMAALKPRPSFGVLIMSEESRLGREQIERGTEFVIEVALDAASPRQVADEADDAGEEHHVRVLRFERLRHRERDAVPLLGGFPELPLPCLRQLVILGAAIVLGRFPLRGEPARFLQPVKRREQRSRLDGKGAAGHLLDAA